MRRILSLTICWPYLLSSNALVLDASVESTRLVICRQCLRAKYNRFWGRWRDVCDAWDYGGGASIYLEGTQCKSSTTHADEQRIPSRRDIVNFTTHFTSHDITTSFPLGYYHRQAKKENDVKKFESHSISSHINLFLNYKNDKYLYGSKLDTSFYW